MLHIDPFSHLDLSSPERRLCDCFALNRTLAGVEFEPVTPMISLSSEMQSPCDMADMASKISFIMVLRIEISSSKEVIGSPEAGLHP